MVMHIQYITIEQAIEIHKKTVEKSGGGAIGHLELGKIKGVLGNIRHFFWVAGCDGAKPERNYYSDPSLIFKERKRRRISSSPFPNCIL